MEESRALLQVLEQENKPLDDANASVDMTAIDQASVTSELLETLVMAIPLVLTSILEFLPFATSVALVGHMDSPLTKEYVDASSMSYLIISVTGVSAGFGIMSALDTLCSQSVGAGKLYNLGMYFQCGLIVMSVWFVPIFFLNWNAEAILTFLKQDPQIVALTAPFNKVAVLGLPGLFLYELMKKGLQAQGIVTPMVWIAALDNVLFAVSGYWMCYHTSFGFYGAALARSVCYLLLPIFAYAYLMWNPVHKDWWPDNHPVASQWKAAWDHVPEFLRLGVPGLFMLIMETFAFDLCQVMVGWMPNPVLSLSVVNVLANLNAQIYGVYFGLSMACTIRVGNALGADEPNRTKAIVKASLLTILVLVAILATIFLSVHQYLPHLFIRDAVAIEAVKNTLGAFIFFMCVDGINAICQSIMRGMGQQAMGACVNAVAYYAVGLPLMAFFGFYCEWGVKGTWFGLALGILTSLSVYLLILYRTDWHQMAKEAVQRTETEHGHYVAEVKA
ncbi:hypothetical protein LEN26_014364 [Aphanomyces euteiches]|nr:hypothetical protein LEN26_014364 [Aphanomyces euteiches]KAH9115178.1 hypothetical protein AeMF1_010761 [Aphanomyces euteiches]KAH9192129.1 hypothetical protein AeNC1_005892 [Aphanomyces euteiches]